MADLITRVQHALILCQRRLKVDPTNTNSLERFVIGSSNANTPIRAVVSVFGDLVYEADLRTLRPNATTYQAVIKDNLGAPYKLQQIQDCHNYITGCLNLIDIAVGTKGKEQVSQDIQFLSSLTAYIRNAIDSLTQPPRKTVEEHMTNPNRRCFHPPVPKDVILSFFVRGPVLVFAAYVLGYNGHNKRWEIVGRNSVDCIFPRLKEVLESLHFANNTVSYLGTLLSAPLGFG